MSGASRVNVRMIVFTAMFVAIMSAASQLVLPIGPVPVSMSTLAVLLAGALLGPAGGATALAVYVLLGALGAPVFSAFRGGISMLAGPTGGYIAGYIPMAAIAGALYTKNSLVRSVLGMLLGNIVLYLVGSAWFMFSTGQGLESTLMLCVVPFLPGDALKIAVALLIAHRLEPLMTRMINKR